MATTGDRGETAEPPLQATAGAPGRSFPAV